VEDKLYLAEQKMKDYVDNSLKESTQSLREFIDSKINRIYEELEKRVTFANLDDERNLIAKTQNETYAQ